VVTGTADDYDTRAVDLPEPCPRQVDDATSPLLEISVRRLADRQIPVAVIGEPQARLAPSRERDRDGGVAT
jgi:hypothetical protein